MNRRAEYAPRVIREQKELDQLVADCVAAGRFAFDTEFVMEDRYESEVCLIQVAVGETVAIVDPFLEVDLGGFWALIGDPGVEKVVHAGQEDLAISVQFTGAVPRNIFDTQVAGGLVGPDYPLSLQRLVQSLLHVRLHKSKTLTNWRKRPLTPEQVRYAAEDVVHLPAVYRKLRERLARRNRLEWAREEFARFEDMTLYRRVEEDRVQRIKGAGSLRGRERGILLALFRYREAFARRVNRPARVVLKDHLMIEIARQGMTKFADIRDLRGMQLSDREVHRVCQVVEEALAAPVPERAASAPRDEEAPWEAAVAALATGVLRAYCLDHDLAYSLVATQKSIRELIRRRASTGSLHEREVDLLRGWRGQTAGKVLNEVLSGLRTVRVNGSPGELHVGTE